jgi:hypothetical protein
MDLIDALILAHSSNQLSDYLLWHSEKNQTNANQRSYQ